MSENEVFISSVKISRYYDDKIPVRSLSLTDLNSFTFSMSWIYDDDYRK